MITVFDFRLGQRGVARDAPIDRLLASIDEPLLDQVGEEAQLVGFIFLVEREVGLVPGAEHAETYELRALHVDVFTRVGFAGFADGRGLGAGIAGLAHFLGHFELDRQPMAIPARHVRRALAAQAVALDDHVLENLVQRVADVHLPVGKGRAVVQHEFFLRAGAGRLNLFIEPAGLPFFQPLRFARHQVGFHGKVSARQIERVFIVHCQSGKGAAMLRV